MIDYFQMKQMKRFETLFQCWAFFVLLKRELKFFFILFDNTSIMPVKRKTTTKKSYSKSSSTKKTSSSSYKSKSWYSKGWYKQDKDALNFYGISIGRVQNPILRTCIEKYLDPLLNWKGLELKKKLSLVDEYNNKWDFSLNKQFETQYEKMQKAYDILHKAFENWNKTFTITDISESTSTLKRCEPFSLSTLQSECLNIFGMKPKETMAAAQKLFEMWLTSYPRTDSITVPEEYEEKIKNALWKEYKHMEYKDKGDFVQAWHYAIIFTSNKFKYNWNGLLSINAPVDWELAEVYELIVRRTLAAFYKDDAKWITTTYTGTYKVWKWMPFEYKTKKIAQKWYLTIYNYPNDWEWNQYDWKKWDELGINDIILKDIDIKISVNIGLNKIKNDLESRGIARPSTWASILQTVEDKQLVKTSWANLLALPKWVRFWYLLQNEYEKSQMFETFDLELTAWMEKELDAVASWKKQSVDLLNKVLVDCFQKYL